MREAEYTRQKARVERYTEGWAHILHMGAWHLVACWHDDYDQEDSGSNPRGAMMRTEARWQYGDLRLHVYLPSVAEVEDDATLEMIVVHEYMHALLDELRPPEGEPGADYMQHEEHACTMLAKAFIKVRDLAEEIAEERIRGEVLPAAPSPNGEGQGVTPVWEKDGSVYLGD